MTPHRSMTLRPIVRAQALAAMLAATGLVAQVAPAPAPEAATAPRQPVPVTQNTAAKPAASTDEVIELSPFEVVSDSRGYFATNTMSGTRFNTKVEDLASSLSVVTKEQMEDFGMLDLNDVFLYTAGAEGTGTYTDYVMDRNGQLTDNVQMNPTGANRIRGVAAANQSYGNYETQGRMPIDPLITDAIEVSRGPNANVFGLGNASGTANAVPVSANLTRDRSRAEVRVDSYEGYRTSLDINRVIKKNVLAVRVNGAFQHDAFIRKPSGVNTVRYNGMIKYQPFKNTTISGAFLHYRMNGNRPNYTPPRDYISDWVNNGKPSWDPVRQVIHLNGQTIDKNGVVTGGRAIVPITADSAIPSYVPITRSGTIQTRGNLYIDQGGIGYWSAPNANSQTASFVTPAANNQTVRLMQTGILGANLGRFTNQPLWTTTPTVGDHSWYDWSEQNLSSVNRLMDRTNTYSAQIDQTFFNTPRQMLVAQVGFFREDSLRYQRTPLGNSGTSGQTGQLFVDVNEYNLDGTVNPYFGRPYLAATEPLTRWMPMKWDTYRGQVAYKLDLREESNWLKWLGMHQLSGYNEYKYRIQRQYSYREALTSNHTWTETGRTGFLSTMGRAVQSNVSGGPQAGANVVRQYLRYYVGDANGSNIDYAPQDFNHGNYTFNWGGYRTVSSGVVSDPVFYKENATLGLLASTDGTGGNNNVKTIIKTPGAVLQSQFFNGALVTMFGMRQDKVYSKFGNTPNLVNGNTEHDFITDNGWQTGDYRYSSGRTKTTSIVARPFREFAFTRNMMNSNNPVVSALGHVARGLSVTYNQSDNFFPQAPAVDLYFKELPNTTGKGKDYGFWLDLFDSKLVLRFNHYITRQLNARDGDANTVAQRVLRLDLDISADNYQLYDRATDWWTLTHPDWTATQVRQAVADQMKIPIDQYDRLVTNFRAGTIAATNDIIATGNEVEIDFNPTRYWTVKASVVQQKSISANVSQTVQQWINERMPIWTSIVDQNSDPNLGTGASQGWVDAANPQHLWWKHSYSGSQTPEQNYASFVNAPYSVIKQMDGKSKPSVREYTVKVSSSLQLAQFTENRILKNFKVGGAVRWEDQGAIGFYGLQELPAVVTELNPNRPIWDKAHTYVDAFISYRTKLFRNRVGANFQLNVRNLGENGRLQPIGAFPDGTPNAFRIVDPQQFFLTASFDL
ncbi:TonB-dependent receptor plug domain-containing protein [Opitutus sp. ER46]|uniref:TonB-dependent receptor plug domain-containing protein n=1 Tax=Opitutus sp. ER46 TaxID=2161864 RepID=UPI001304ADFE|nr:TonB-dependent receptor plug domain-containing protein [Opitutus sp. ER46]